MWIWWVHADPHLPATAEKLIRETPATDSHREHHLVLGDREVDRASTPDPAREREHVAGAGDAAQCCADRFSHASDHRRFYELASRFHKDPADQLIVATARTLGALLLTVDEKIVKSPHVRTFMG